jgi:hypothetical protein
MTNRTLPRSIKDLVLALTALHIEHLRARQPLVTARPPLSSQELDAVFWLGMAVLNETNYEMEEQSPDNHFFHVAKTFLAYECDTVRGLLPYLHDPTESYENISGSSTQIAAFIEAMQPERVAQLTQLAAPITLIAGRLARVSLDIAEEQLTDTEKRSALRLAKSILDLREDLHGHERDLARYRVEATPSLQIRK